MSDNPNHNFKNNVNFQHQHLGAITNILRQHAYLMVNMRLSTVDEDTKQATDMVIEMDNKATVAVRIRRWQTYGNAIYRDFTIRAKARGGQKTELAKLREGWADWYVYAWENEAKLINEFILINLPQLRKSGYLNSWQLNPKGKPYKENGDGTAFNWLEIGQLKKSSALVAAVVKVDGYWESYKKEAPLIQFAMPEHLKKAG